MNLDYLEKLCCITISYSEYSIYRWVDQGKDVDLPSTDHSEQAEISVLTCCVMGHIEKQCMQFERKIYL